MREVPQPITKRVFEGDVCRVAVVRRDDERIDVQVSVMDRDMQHLPPIFAMSPESFAVFASEIAAVASRVADTALEIKLEIKADALKREAVQA